VQRLSLRIGGTFSISIGVSLVGRGEEKVAGKKSKLRMNLADLFFFSFLFLFLKIFFMKTL
jgi:hypothetical protein